MVPIFTLWMATDCKHCTACNNCGILKHYLGIHCAVKVSSILSEYLKSIMASVTWSWLPLFLRAFCWIFLFRLLYACVMQESTADVPNDSEREREVLFEAKAVTLKEVTICSSLILPVPREGRGLQKKACCTPSPTFTSFQAFSTIKPNMNFIHIHLAGAVDKSFD